MASRTANSLSRDADRRSVLRYPAREMLIQIAPKGRLGHCLGTVLDFNRHGCSALLKRPIELNKPVFVTLSQATISLRGIVAVIHNCRQTPDGQYRCGVQFRLQSPLQMDREQTLVELSALEACLEESLPTQGA